jgi:hypothetical protein
MNGRKFITGRGRWISEFQASLVYRVSQDRQGYTEKPCLEKPKKKKKKKKRCGEGLGKSFLTLPNTQNSVSTHREGRGSWSSLPENEEQATAISC